MIFDDAHSIVKRLTLLQLHYEVLVISFQVLFDQSK